VSKSLLKRAVSLALSQHGLAKARVCLLLTSDDRIRELNRNFRRIDAPTDVLTFPSGDFPPQSIGDVAISVPYAERQAAVRGVHLNQELGFLAIHGALHLCGLDDVTEVDRVHMIAEMNRAAVAAGLAPDDDWASILHDTVPPAEIAIRGGQ
jgi:rRNA maturation RNase YbeY